MDINDGGFDRHLLEVNIPDWPRVIAYPLAFPRFRKTTYSTRTSNPRYILKRIEESSVLDLADSP